MARRPRKRRFLDTILIIFLLLSFAGLFGARLIRPIPDDKWMCRDAGLRDVLDECKPYRIHSKR
jgi:hypothetical protein